MAESPPSTATIETQHLTLREARPWDLPAVHELYKDKNVMRYMSTPHGSINRTAIFFDDMVQSSSNGTLAFVIVLPPFSASAVSSSTSAALSTKSRSRLPIPTRIDEGIVIGHAGLWVAGENQLSFMIGKPYWGKGYMTEVLAALVPIFWAKGLNKVYTNVDPANVASVKILRKSGFKQVREDMIESRYGKETNLNMELINPEYREEGGEGEGEGEAKREGKGKGKGEGKGKGKGERSFLSTVLIPDELNK